MSRPWEQYGASTGPWTQYSGQAPARQPARKRSPLEDATGFLAKVNRGLGIGDELAAGVATASDVVTGKTPLTKAGDAFNTNMARQRQIEDSYQQAHPNLAALATGTGNAGLLAIPAGDAGLATQATGLLGRGVNAARGAVTAATQGAAYSLADRGTARERIGAADRSIAPSALLGGVIGAAAPVRAAPKAPTPQRTLKAAGVSLTPGQQIGGLAKSTEDLAQRAPILGPAIRGARERGVASLNRAVANRALQPLGEVVPPNVKNGHPAVSYVADRLGKEYDQAAAMVPQVVRDPEFNAALANINTQISELPADLGVQFKNILKNRLDSRFAGPISGQQLRTIQSEISGIAAKRSASEDGGQQALGDMLEGVSDELKNLLGRANPAAGEKIATANEGWSSYVRLRNAAARSNKNGIFTPSQLSTSVRMTDKSVGKGNVAKGQAVLQDLSGAASRLMPDAFGNPGTADAVGLGALGTMTLMNPIKGAGVAAGLTAAATPYMLMGRKIVTELPSTASRAEIESAVSQLAALAGKDPKVIPYQRMLEARLSRSAGLLGAYANQSGPATPPAYP